MIIHTENKSEFSQVSSQVRVSILILIKDKLSMDQTLSIFIKENVFYCVHPESFRSCKSVLAEMAEHSDICTYPI